ncbi:MAG: hypothetical protein ACHRXM_37805 [Isosphaerales bacterium]
MKDAIRFAVITSAGTIVGLLALWSVTGFSSFGLGSDDLAFLIPGIVFTILVAVALMTVMV